MRSVLKKPKKANMAQEPVEKPKPVINQDVFKKWLSDKVTSFKNVIKTEAVFLWKEGSYERYRVNVWVAKKIENHYCEKIFIEHSWFVHYNRTNDKIVDKTIS